MVFFSKDIINAIKACDIVGDGIDKTSTIIFSVSF